jgi:hypothetical protein
VNKRDVCPDKQLLRKIEGPGFSLNPILQPDRVQATAQRTGREQYPLEASQIRPETRLGASGENTLQFARVHYAVYGAALAVSISTWFVAIRAPLWLDETISLFLIKDGFSGITRPM